MRTLRTDLGWSAINTTSHRSSHNAILVPVCMAISVCCVQEEQGAVEIVAGEEVYIEQAEGVLSGRVTEVGSQTQYEVAFEDGSVCSNLSTADILVGQSLCTSIWCDPSCMCAGSAQLSSTAGQ